MKKFGIFTIIIILAIAIFALGYDYNHAKSEPNTYYQVYLEKEVLGVIKSKKELEKYIDKKGDYYKKKYSVSKIYEPNGLEIKKVTTYKKETTSVKKIYEEIEKRAPFTVKGYQITIKKNDQKRKIYVTKEKYFKEALENLIITFIGEEKYNAYKNKEQKPIETTGSIIESIEVENGMTIKETNIPVNAKIYTDAKSLSKFLLFGENQKQSKYTVEDGDTISTVAFKNKISEEEFLISNTAFSSANSLLFPGQVVNIGITDPQVNIVVIEHNVADEVSKYTTEEQYDPDRIIGDDEIIQKGENGLERITRNIKSINGTITYVEPVSKVELKPTINEIILKGEKYVPNVGSLTNWAWPTSSGYIISSTYGYRINPFGGTRELHDALDIAGAGGHGSPIYAANNGVVVVSEWHYSYGNYIVINHNNGYYTLYAHCSKLLVSVGQTVAKGQQIALMGMTGSATGPHLHFGLWVGQPMRGGYSINPYTVY